MSSSIPSWQILTAHAQPFRGARDLSFCLKVPLDSLLVWASSGGSGETARMRRLAWTFTARIGDKYQIRLTRSRCWRKIVVIILKFEQFGFYHRVICPKDADRLSDKDLQCLLKLAASWQNQQKWHVCPAKTQISLGIRTVWSESSLCTPWVAKDPSFLDADSEDSDQTGQMLRLIWVFAGRTFVLLV